MRTVRTLSWSFHDDLAPGDNCFALRRLIHPCTGNVWSCTSLLKPVGNWNALTGKLIDIMLIVLPPEDPHLTCL